MKKSNILRLAASVVVTLAITLAPACSTPAPTPSITPAITSSPTPKPTPTPAPDKTPPMVSSIFPDNTGVDVATNSVITAIFNKPMDPRTLTNIIFTLKQGSTPVSGTVTYTGFTATFKPAVYLTANTGYTATMSTGAKDISGNALAKDFVSTFTTGLVPDTTPPMVSSTIPANNGSSVAVNGIITAFFSEAMDPLTVTAETFFTLKQGLTPVAGAVTSVGQTAVFTPDGPLASAALYTATLTTGTKDLAGNALAGNYSWSFNTVSPSGGGGGGGNGGGGGTPASDTTPPMVGSTTPANATTGLAINSAISAVMSEALNPLTVTTTTVTLKQGTTPVTGTVTYSGFTAIFTPLANLTSSTLYTATIMTGVKDLAGNAMAANYVWSFTTGVLADIIPPTVSSTIPINAATGVAVTSKVNATFSEALGPLTVTTATFTLKQGVTPVAGAVTYALVTATFTPAVNLTASTLYTATITTGVKDLAGNALATNYVWSFTTGVLVDIIPPTVSSVIPVNAATGVAINGKINATFSELINATTVTNVSFTLKQGVTPVAGAVTYAGLNATFAPTVNLAPSTTYNATITTGVKDLAGNAMASNYTWSFTTGLTVIARLPVNLGTAGNFVILAKSAVSTVPASAITGNVGVSPAATTFLTGFSLTKVGTTSATSPQVTGNLYGADMTTPTNSNLTTAVSDMEAAYTDAAGRTIPDHTELGAGDITSMTLTPGLYKWGTGLLISAGGVTLSGNATDVWIFQIAQNLNLANGGQVTLSGGALPKNIFWQVAGQTTLGTTAVMNGIILCQTAIVMNTGARLNGRALAQTAVNLDQNIVTKPAP